MSRTPTLNYFCTKVNIPGIELPPAWQGTPFVDIPQPGDRAAFKPFVASFNVDEDLKNYFEIHAWMRALGKMINFDDYKTLKDAAQYTGTGLESEIVLFILNSNRNANFAITFHDAFPIDLSDIEFDHQLTDFRSVPATVTFRYTYFDYQLKSVNAF